MLIITLKITSGLATTTEGEFYNVCCIYYELKISGVYTIQTF